MMRDLRAYRQESIRRHLLLTVFALAFLLTSPLDAQAPKPEAQLAAMRRLDYMAGNWQGEGWIEFNGTRRNFRGGELVQRKLDGVVLLVEGNFLARIPGVKDEVPVHTTLGVISFDPGAQKYRFHTWLSHGSSGERELVVNSDGWQWEIQGPQGVMRYRMSLTPQGEWREVGERSADGQTWRTFFEMTLRKAP
jgi:hypothetical protein